MMTLFLGAALAEQKPLAKKCPNCGREYATRREFLKLPLPSGGFGQSLGMHWRQCSCHSTITIPIKEKTK